MKKYRITKLLQAVSWLHVPAHSCSSLVISVSQAAAHWLQRKVRQGLVFWYSKMRLVACGLALQPTVKNKSSNE